MACHTSPFGSGDQVFVPFRNMTRGSLYAKDYEDRGTIVIVDYMCQFMHYYTLIKTVLEPNRES